MNKLSTPVAHAIATGERTIDEALLGSALAMSHHPVTVKRGSISAVILLVGGGVLAWSWFSEPRYAGKTLSAWLEVAATVDENGAPTGFDEAREAISHIDARGVSILLNWMQAQDSPLKETLYRFLNKQSLVTFRYRSAEEKHMLAAFGFSCLKSKADSACPQLAGWLFATNDPYNCANALAGIGPAGVPAINTALTNANTDIQRAAAYAALNLRTNALLTNMFLVLNNAEPGISSFAAQWLKEEIPREDYFHVLTFLLHRPAVGLGSAPYAFRELMRMTNEWPRAFPHIACLLTNSSVPFRGMQRQATMCNPTLNVQNRKLRVPRVAYREIARPIGPRF